MAKNSNVPEDKLNLMGAYFPQYSSTYKVIDQMRKSIFEGRKAPISLADIDRSHDEIMSVRGIIDDSTAKFAQDLNKVIFNDDKVRALMLIRGNFVGSNSGVETTVLAIDLGTNPWPLYKNREGYDTIDKKLTVEKAREYMDGKGEELRKRGINGFNVDHSSFYYVKNHDLAGKFAGEDGAINFDDFVRVMVDTYGFIGLTRDIKKPGDREYRAKAIPFTSYRQKQSLLEKAIRELCQVDPYLNFGDVITDWGGHRIGCANVEEARALGDGFKEKRPVGVFEVSELHTDDYYTKPKRTGFSSLNIAALVSSSRFDSVVREIQIYDLINHFNGQINESHPAFHRRLKELQSRSRKKMRVVLEGFEYDNALRIMFGSEKLVVPFK